MKKKTVAMIMTATVVFTSLQANTAFVFAEGLEEAKYEETITEEDVTDAVPGQETDVQLEEIPQPADGLIISDDTLSSEDDFLFVTDDFTAELSDDSSEALAKSTKDTVTVTWDGNGGESYWEGETIFRTIKKKGSKEDGLAVNLFRRDGYLFIGVVDQDGNTYGLDDEITFSKDMTLKAVWEKGVLITWDVNGGKFYDKYEETYLDTYKSTYEKGENVHLYKEGFVGYDDCFYSDEIFRDGYALAGWEDQDGNKYDVMVDTVFNKDTTLKAIWIETITITYDGNGVLFGWEDEGQSTTSQSKCAKGRKCLLAPEDWIYWDGYGISGWLDSEGNKYEAYTEVFFTKDITLKAVWGKYVTVKWDGNGGDLLRFAGEAEMSTEPVESAESEYVSGSKLSKWIFNDVVRPGYDFVGWSTSLDKKDIITLQLDKDHPPVVMTPIKTIYYYDYVVTDDITFYAIWEPEQSSSPISISDYTVTVSNQTYTGKALTPDVTIKDKKGNALKKETDYTVAYKNNINAGTATVTITGKGNYTGTLSKNFKINKASIAKAKVTGIADKVYTGKSITPAPSVKLSSVKLKKNTNYTVTYKNNKAVGTATVTIKGKGNYSGTISKTFQIIPKGTTLSKVTGAAKKMTVIWKKQAVQTTGYQIQYSTNKNFKSGVKTQTVSGSGKTSVTIKKLTAKKTYYVRIRTYKKVGKSTYYSGWSKALTGKIK